MDGFNTGGQPHEYWAMIETDSTQNYDVNYGFQFSWRIVVPIALIFAIIAGAIEDFG